VWLAPLLASAQEASPVIDLAAICAGQSLTPRAPRAGTVRLADTPDGVLAFLDTGFCAAYLESKREDAQYAAMMKPNPALDYLQSMAPNGVAAPATAFRPRWKVRFYASHSFTTYFPTNISFKSSRYDITVKDYQWAEQSSRNFFSPKTWRKPGNNPLQVLDEPTNTFVVSIERNGHEFFLSAFHPKFTQAEDQVKYMKGTIDGTPVDGYAPVNKPFDGYDQTPGESEIVRNAFTYRQMAFEIGYGRRFVLLDSRIGSISYVPSVAAGVMVGQNVSVVIEEGKWWDFDDGGDSYGINGIGGSLTNRIELNTPKERFGIFYENKLSAYKMKSGFHDGTQTFNLGLMGNSVGVKFMIYNPENHRRKARASWAAFQKRHYR